MPKYIYSILIISNLFSQVDYSTQIQPIFDNNCISCHIDGGTYFGGLDLSSYSEVMEGGSSGNTIVPFDHSSSELFNRITLDESDNEFMPKNGTSLSQSEIDLIAQWIDEGALQENNNSFSIEGRWILPMFEGDPGNTMYEFLDGLRYTYYCADENGCDSTYWNSLDTSDALPTINPYTVDDSTLSIDLHFGNTATYTMNFRCDGQVVDFYYDEDDSWEGLHSTMFRVGSDISECEELNSYSIEGRWLWGYGGFTSTPSTMYEFLDGLRYTYYCSENNGCDSTYWNSLDTSDAIPNPDLYTFINDTLTIDGGSGSFIDFECDGNIILSGDDIVLWRVGLDTSDCENQLEVVFTKQDSADWTLPENQDRIAETVWITRKHNQSIFNIAQEEGYSVSNGSPLGTLWANSSTENAQSSDFTSFVLMHGGNPQSIINDTVSLYLPDYERYFDLVFLSFSGGNSGGGFSYSRNEVFPDHFSSGHIEGRWIIPVVENDPGNTMYEFLDGLRYTYYCADENGCDSTYWNSLDTSEAIPNPNPYTFLNDTLTIDLFFGNTWQYPVTFECDGNKVSFGDTTFLSWWRVGLDTSECEEQQLGMFSDITHPETFRLHQNYPNPFNPVTIISYELLEDSYVSVIIYDMLGNVIKNLVKSNQSFGYNSVQWNATNNKGQPVSAGVYLYSLEAGDFRQSNKMILLK